MEPLEGPFEKELDLLQAFLVRILLGDRSAHLNASRPGYHQVFNSAPESGEPGLRGPNPGGVRRAGQLHGHALPDDLL